MSIPKTFHHVWTSGDRMPAQVQVIRQTWIDRHPDWEFRIWRAEDLGWLRNRALFDKAPTYAQKADIARYEIVDRFGGVYLDTDMECLRPLDELLEGCEFFSARQHDGVVAIGIFGALPGHPVLRETIARIPVSCLVHQGVSIPAQTGPLLLDRIVRAGGWEGTAGVRIFPQAFFYPYEPLEPWRREGPFPRAYAVHHWHHSWRLGAEVKSGLSDLTRSGGSPSRMAGALWAEAVGLIKGRTTQERIRLERRVKRAVIKAVRRIVPATPAIRAIPWQPGEILVAAPLGTRLLCPTDALSIAPDLALTGTHAPEFVDLIGQRMKRGMTFVHVGAGIGFFTVLAASRLGPGGRVFAIESNPADLQFLERNVAMNWFGDRVVISEERFPLGLPEPPYIDLLKIDVVGQEAEILDAAHHLIDRDGIGVVAFALDQDRLTPSSQEQFEKKITSMVQDSGATLHVPGDPRPLSIDEVVTVFAYPALLVRFPHSSIEP